MTNPKLDRLLELESGRHLILDSEDEQEYKSLKSKIESQLENGDSTEKYIVELNEQHTKITTELESKVKESEIFKEETLCVVDDMKKRVKALEEELGACSVNYHSEHKENQQLKEKYDDLLKISNADTGVILRYKEAIEKIGKLDYKEVGLGIHKIKAILESIGDKEQC